MYNKRSVFIALYSPQRFLELFSFAEKLGKGKGLNIILYVSAGVLLKYGDTIKNCKLKIVKDPRDSAYYGNPKNTLNKVKNSKLSRTILIKIKNIMAGWSLVQLLQEKKYFNYLIGKYQFFINIFDSDNVDFVIVTGDRHVYEEPAILKAAHDKGIKILLPYLVNYSEYEVIQRQRVNKVLRTPSLYSYHMNRKYSVNIHNGFKYYPSYIIGAIGKLGALSANPWIMGRGLSSIMCVDSKNTYSKYIEYGVTKDKLIVVGDISYDLLYNEWKNKDEIKTHTLKKYKLKNKKNIIVALPQLAEDNLMSWDKHWDEISFILSNLDNQKYNIFLSLHPKMDILQYNFLKKKYNCNILPERLVYMLPIADLFIATYSSTIVWSTLCGIKTIIMDFYGLNYSKYEHIKSILLVNNKKLLYSSVKTFIDTEVDFSYDWSILSRDVVFDGKVLDRYYDIIYRG